MEKILTISIAAYNVESYIRRCLESLICPELMDKIEIIIIDDGGTDSTVDIAREYEAIYPDTFRIIHKENEGYGSTVNYSIANARGKYIKLLDGDDWYDKMGLQQLVKQLELIEADVVFNDVCIFDDYGNEILYDNIKGKQGIYRISEIDENRYYSMWYMTFKTDILRKSGVILPKKSLYTDQYLCVIPFKYVKIVSFAPFLVYCYRVGRKDQSNSYLSIQRHYKEAMSVCEECCNIYSKTNPDSEYKEFIKNECIGIFRHAMKILLYLPTDHEKEMARFDKLIMNIAPDVCSGITIKRYRKLGLIIKILRITNYATYDLVKHLVLKLIVWNPL